MVSASSSSCHVEIRRETPDNTIVHLNVRGTRFVTTLGTLRKYPDSFLGAMFSGRHSNLKSDETGAVFLDRDPMLFGIALQFLRSGVWVCVQAECLSYMLPLSVCTAQSHSRQKLGL